MSSDILCPHCHEPLTKSEVARLLALLSAGKPKNFPEKELSLRRERMRAINQRRRLLAPRSTGMQHRHLTHQDFTLAAIDDVIGRGKLHSWVKLREAVDTDPAMSSRILRVCAAHIGDPFAQRYHFWKNYVSR
jgi:hypothetical protein